MLPKEVLHIGDGLIEAKEEFLRKILVSDADIEQHYDVEVKPFARGNFGTVRRATHKETGIKYAAKFLRRRRRAACWAKQIQHEIAVLMLSADSEQIVRLHAVYETRSEFVLILEMAAGGELQAILDEDGFLTEQKSRVCVRQVLKALDYLHLRNVAHLDIKPQNILLNTNNVDDGLKLCDFGFSRAIADGRNVCEIQGTPDYVAPEIVQYEPLSLKTDIWSIGVLAYVLLTGYSPFGSDDKQETFLNITKCNLTFPDELFQDVSDDAIDFIKCTLRLKPCDRLDVNECLNHKWLASDTTTNITATISSPSQHQQPQQILTVQSSNVTIITQPPTSATDHETIDVINCKSSCVTSSLALDDDNNKENTLKALEKGENEPTTTIITSKTSTSVITIQHHNSNNISTTSAGTKMVLEKSSSISLFPDAPTTPKVCRKAPYDDDVDLSSQVKEIVKKYQTIEHQAQHQQQQKYPTPACCTNENVGECLVCHPQISTNKPPSLELDKGIIC